MIGSKLAAPVSKPKTRFITEAVRTVKAPKTEPRMPPATGPKNWKRVKNWFFAPARLEKFILLLTITKTTNRRKKNALVEAEKRFIPNKTPNGTFLYFTVLSGNMKGAIVTGGAKGLGRKIALMLAKEGYAVAINYNRSKKEAEETLAELGKIKKGCIALQGDLTKEKNVKKLVSTAFRKFGRIDVLINNIGDFLYKPLLKTTPQEIGHVFRNNVITAFMCSREAIKVMQKQKYGRIINIGCTGCDELLAPENTTPYYMAKTGVLLMTKAIARSAGKGITVNAVSPGILKTSVVGPKGVTAKHYTTFDEVTKAIKSIIKSRKNGINLTVARWRPYG